MAVVSQPDSKRGRGRALRPSPISTCAMEHDIPLLRPVQVNDPAVRRTLEDAAPDLGVVVAFGQFLGRPIRELPRLGYLINAHASLLPRYRGASPIIQAIVDGESHTGISIMRVEREMDAGAVGLVRKVEIRNQENGAELTERLSQIAAEAILTALDRITTDEIEWVEQDHSRASLAPKLLKRDGWLDWTLPTATLIRRIHGLAPRPGAFTQISEPAGSEPTPLRILRASEWKHARAQTEPPGTLRRAGDLPNAPSLRVATGDGWLMPMEVQRAGAKAMSTDDFLRGFPLPDGARLGGDKPQEPTSDA